MVYNYVSLLTVEIYGVQLRSTAVQAIKVQLLPACNIDMTIIHKQVTKAVRINVLKH